jgi:hypothetical protein
MLHVRDPSPFVVHKELLDETSAASVGVVIVGNVAGCAP